MSDFTRQAQKAGFTAEQAAFLDAMVAKFPHDHAIEDIEGLEEALDEAGVEFAESSDDDD